ALCEGWRARDLAAHLVIRERRPDAALGMVASPLAGYTSRVQRSVRDGQPWEQLVQRVRTGPPFPFSLAPVDSMVNTVEYFVHLEDVRRAAPHWTVRPLDDDLVSALWSRLRLIARMVAGRAPVGVVLEAPGRGVITAKAKDPRVKVVGEPGELVLWAFGRQRAAEVRYEGDREAVSELSRAKLGF
ncbi:MAG TPA: TIGR03085 family metal-binding protein, partial [Acidimicrobiales bacterium]|nr:TIGR03085 family metal-binding protein [Acidimicrobiales bacterium]